MIHDEDTVADLFHLFHVMAGVDYGRALAAELLDAFENRIAALRVHGNGRFVEEDQVGLMRDAACDVEAAQQSAGQFRRSESAVVLQSHEIQRFVHQLASAGLVTDIERAEIIDVFLDGELIEHGDVLRNDADATLQRVTGRADRFPEHAYRTRVEREQREYAVDRRGLARTVRPEQAEDFALTHVEVKIVERQHIAVTFDEMRHLHRAHGGMVFVHGMLLAPLVPLSFAGILRHSA